jgi:radical SAM superfamily enzyme YgiQ (UPF0313 family)
MRKRLNVAVVITRPRFHTFLVPLGYLYVSAALKAAGFSVRVINASIRPRNSRNFLAAALEATHPDLVITGTSYKFHNNCPSSTVGAAVDVTILAKRANPHCVALLIGPLNTVLAPRLLRYSTVDAVALGEPENIAAAAARALAGGVSLSSVPGLALRGRDGPCYTGTTPFPDPNALPLPDREAVDYSRYVVDSYFARRTTELLSSRGCPFDCTYCFGARSSRRNTCHQGKAFRATQPERVVEEIDYLYRRWGVRGIKFSDVEFGSSSRRVTQICESLLRRGYRELRWRVVTHVKSVTPQRLRLMYRAGCRNIYYGVESGDPAILEAMEKRVGLDEVRRAFRDTWHAGIKPEASFLLGFPGDTEASIRRTLEFSQEIRPFLATFHVFVPFPGIPLADRFDLDPSPQLDQWDVYQLHANRSHCQVPAERLEALSKKAYRDFYLRPARLMRLSLGIAGAGTYSFLWNALRGRCEAGFLRGMILNARPNQRRSHDNAPASPAGDDNVAHRAGS